MIKMRWQLIFWFEIHVSGTFVYLSGCTDVSWQDWWKRESECKVVVMAARNYASTRLWLIMQISDEQRQNIDDHKYISKFWTTE